MTHEKYKIEIDVLKKFYELYCKDKHEEQKNILIQLYYKDKNFSLELNLCNKCFEDINYSLDASKIVANSITSTQINASSVSTAIANVISLDASRITTGKLSADRIDAVSVVTKGLVAQTIDAQSATISNLNVVNATVNGYFRAEYSGGAFVRIGQPSSPKMLAIRADGLTGIDIGVYGDNSTGLSITANLNNSRALNIHGSNYLITRLFSVAEGTWINGLSLCRVTITSGVLS